MLGVTFRQLEVFVETVDVGSFHGSAERLGVAQVSVSGHIQAMERALGHPLFVRRPGSAAELTPEGRVAYRHAVTLLEEMRAMMNDLGGQGRANLRRRLVVAASSYVSFRLAPIIAEFGNAHPEWQIEIEPSDLQSAETLIENGKADLGFTMSLEGRPPVNSEFIWREQLGVFVGKDHPLAKKLKVSSDDLARVPHIYLPKNYPLRTVMDDAMAQLGILGSPIALQTENAALAQKTLLKGNAAAVLFADMLRSDLDRGDLVELNLEITTPALEVRLIKAKGALVGRAARSLMEIVNEASRNNLLIRDQLIYSVQ